MPEPWLLDHLPAGGRLAIDIGANVGDWTGWLAERFETVHAFEPHPAALTELHRRYDSRAKIVDAAVGANPGELELFLYRETVHASAFADQDLDTHTRGTARGSIPVPLLTLDLLGYDAQPVDLIKIDVEGYECEVLRGARRTLRARTPRLVIEIHSERNGSWCAPFLEQLDYRLTRVAHPAPEVAPGHHWLIATAGARDQGTPGRI